MSTKADPDASINVQCNMYAGQGRRIRGWVGRVMVGLPEVSRQVVRVRETAKPIYLADDETHPTAWVQLSR